MGFYIIIIFRERVAFKRLNVTVHKFAKEKKKNVSDLNVLSE